MLCRQNVPLLLWSGLHADCTTIQVARARGTYDSVLKKKAEQILKTLYSKVGLVLNVDDDDASQTSRGGSKKHFSCHDDNSDIHVVLRCLYYRNKIKLYRREKIQKDITSSKCQKP